MSALEFEVWCSECGNGLCRLTTVDRQNVNVEPCPKCIEKARQEGYDEGHNDGYQERKGEEEE